jgi:hypothetical protein
VGRDGLNLFPGRLAKQLRADIIESTSAIGWSAQSVEVPNSRCVESVIGTKMESKSHDREAERAMTVVRRVPFSLAHYYQRLAIRTLQ